MGSRLNILLKKEGVLRVSYSRNGADKLPAYLAFGSAWALHALQCHQDSGGALVVLKDGRADWRRTGNFSSISDLFGAGDEGGIILDWDDKVLWYFSDFHGEKEHAWGAWFATWLEQFWPDWKIFRPQKRSHANIFSVLGFQDTFAHDAASFAKEDWDAIKALPNLKITYDDDPADPEDKEEVRSVLAVIEGSDLRYYNMSSDFGVEGLIAKGPKDLPRENTPSFQYPVSDILNFNICGLVDIDSQKIWTQDHTLVMSGSEHLVFERWDNWEIIGDQQGFPAWLGQAGLSAKLGSIPSYSKQSIDWIVNGCLDVYRKYEDRKIWRLNDIDLSSDIHINEQSMENLLRAMLPAYLTSDNLEKSLLTDRRYNGSSWSPDLSIYCWLNSLNARQ